MRWRNEMGSTVSAPIHLSDTTRTKYCVCVCVCEGFGKQGVGHQIECRRLGIKY